ncbi:endo-1,3-alpha-glucanase family glycosylhydrolase [Bradyrhizobium sp. DASA03007]|uniref:endo-1,3-alpha-glucanase family glycosylhydrolase n=1 Tax=unclassified Bradyrhizobium TaxID=2631580 RepID=UPI003F72AB97
MNMFICFAAILMLLLSLNDAHAEAPGPSQHYVFAHYMVCCPRDGLTSDSSAFQKEIVQASRLGIDGFALNVGAWKKEEKYPRLSLQLFEAAKRYGPEFKLFFSMDNLAVEEATDIVTMFYQHPNYLAHDGKPVVSTFGGTSDWGSKLKAALRDKGIEVFFVPFLYYAHSDVLSHLDASGRNAYIVKRALAESPSLDGYFYFGAANSDPRLARELLTIGKIVKTNGLLSMLGISPFYKGFGPRNSRVFESHGFESMQAQWLSAIGSQADWVEIVTWNDWGEATYVAPFGEPKDQEVWGTHWGKLLAHDRFLEASSYYMRWFKEGRPPPISEDRIYYFYRVHPKSALGYTGQDETALGRPSGSDDLDDQIYITSFLGQQVELKLNVGLTAHTVSLPAGVSTARIPMALGEIHLSAFRNGTEVARKQLEFPITNDGSVGNFNYFAGDLKLGYSTPNRPDTDLH